jgi:polar amino acid transport system substrate-binding protein
VLAAAQPAVAAELVVLVDTGTDMPLALFAKGKLIDGMHRDIGEALARGLGRKVVFVGLPRKRIALALEEGSGDIVCMYMPEWLPGAFDWSTGFAPVVEVLISDRRAPRPQRIEDVAGHKVATVLGYFHPEIEEVLGKQFVRDDGPSAEANLRKMAAGRVQYAVTGKAYIEYRLKQHDLPLALHPPLDIKTYMSQCAVSRKGHVRVAEINAVVAQMLHDGSMDKIVERYR